jgi:L-serine kinase (ADP)
LNTPVTVSVEGLEIRLSIIPLAKVKPHEAGITKVLDSIVADLTRTASQRDPILIDAESGVVLDGMHRRASLEAVGAKFALCSEYRYLDSSVKLERWLRYFIAPSEKFLQEVVSLLKLRECEDFRAGVRAVDRGESEVALLSAGVSYVSDQNWSTLEIYDAVARIDEFCRKYKIEMDYTAESSKFGELFTSESVFLLYPKKLEKRDVLEIAGRGKVFPCKTTRHVVPVRPMGVYFPLEMLVASSEEGCREELERVARSSKIKLEEREVWYEGRRYSEPLAIFRRDR